MFVSLTGFAAGTLCTLAYLPQALHSFRTKSVRDISLLMLISLNVGLVLWVAYGFLIHSLPIILPNGRHVLPQRASTVDEAALPQHRRISGQTRI